MRRRLLALVVAATLAAPPAGALALPAMWTVHGSHATAVLFGSVHLLPTGVQWEPPALAEALAHADEIWFELPIDAATGARAQALVIEKGAQPKGVSLFDDLNAKDAERLRRACDEVGVPPQVLAPMRPWLAEVTLSLAQDARAGAKPSEGVEQQLSQQVGAKVKRRAFETPEQQINFLAAAPRAEQNASLRETLTEVADDPGLYDRAVKAWLSGDLASLRKDSLQSLIKASPAMYRRLIVDRNRRWAAVLDQRLKEEGEIVVVVGAGHLLGPDGLPALLRARGYAIDGPPDGAPSARIDR
jgi:hypothetical protein